MAPLVSIGDFTGWLAKASLTPEESTRAELILAAVSGLVRSAAGKTWETGPVPEPVRAVAFTVAYRVFTNPDAAKSMQVTTGPFGKSVTFADPNAVGLYLTSREKAMVGARRAGLWTLGTTRCDPAPCTTYVPVEGGGDPFPWYGNDDL